MPRLPAFFKNQTDFRYCHVFINIFALVTAFYIMTVYDKILPNFATNSLIALAIGVIIVFIFDYAMKMLRTYYIDIAGASIDRSVGDRIFSIK